MSSVSYGHVRKSDRLLDALNSAAPPAVEPFPRFDALNRSEQTIPLRPRWLAESLVIPKIGIVLGRDSRA